MRILVIMPISRGVYKDDTQMFCDGLEKYFGHTIIKRTAWYDNGQLKTFKNDELIGKVENIDVIWAPYEPLIPVANKIKEKFNVPVVGHFEIVPPGRINLDNININQMLNTEVPKNDFYNEYRFLAEEFLKCDVKTVIGAEEKYKIERLLGRKIKDKTFIKPYPLDNEYLEKYRIKNPEEKNQIVCISTLRPHKKIHHLIRALPLIKNPPKLIIIGHGEIESELKRYVKELGLDVEFAGLIDDNEKFKIIQESMFSVHPWACLPVGENAYFKKPSINYDEPIIRDRLNDMPYYAEDNNIMNLAQCINDFITRPKLRKEWGEKAYNMLKNGETETYFLKEACRKLNDILNYAIR